MLDYRCPRCDEVFVTFKILCHHAETCHDVAYLLREKIQKQSDSFNSDIDFLSRNKSPSADPQLLSEEDGKDPATWSPNRARSTKLISEIRDSFERIARLTNEVRFDANIQSIQPKKHPRIASSEDNVQLRAKRSSNKDSDDDAATRTLSESKQLFAMELVFYYFDSISLWKLRSVCKRWRDMVQTTKYWNQLRLINCLIAPKFLDQISDFCQNLTSITFEDVRLKLALEEKGALEKPLQSILRKSRKKITSISLINCGINLTERTLWLVSCHCPYLEEFAYVSATNPANSESIWSLGAGCRRLRTLIIPPVFPSQAHPEGFSDRCLTTIAKSWSDLKILCVGGTSVSLKGLLAIARRCSNLEVLELDHTGELEESAIPPLCRAGFAKLRAAYFTHTPVSPQAILQLKHFCKGLRKIKVLISPSDFFVQPEYSQNQIEYEKKLISLRNLSRYRGLDEILTVVDLNQF